jgi:carbon-monoxide dehydrogenase medium subunit
MLAANGEGAKAFAGGVALLLIMRQRIFSPSHVVWLGGIRGLDAIEVERDGGLRIGALATHHAVATHPGVRSRFPMIAGMASGLANPQVRNMGTLGGNLCHGDPASDPPACLLALGASLRAVRGSKERVIPLDDFFTDYYTNALAADEIVSEVLVPPLPAGARASYVRFSMTAAEHRPLVTAGALLSLDGRRCRDARLALGAVANVPQRLKRAEDFLRGKEPTAEVVARTAELAVADLEPLVDFRASAQYRREVAQVTLRRCLERALAEGEQS